MSLRTARTRRLAVPAAGLAAALLLAGCGTGQRAQTYQERSLSEATNTAVGAIAVRNVAIPGPEQGIVHPAGSDVPVTFTLVNEGGDDDVLQSASSPAAASVDVVGPSPQVQLPRLQTADRRYGLVLRDLTADLQTGQYVELTLAFQRNGTRTIMVPVQVTPGGAPRPTGLYEIDDTDSAGNPLPPRGDNVPDDESQTKGDNGSDTPSSE